MTKYVWFVAATVFILFGVGGRNKNEADRLAAQDNCAVLEPRNPYIPTSGHSAGYDWAYNNGNRYGDHCGNDGSRSFTEGCQEYRRQQRAFNECISKR